MTNTASIPRYKDQINLEDDVGAFVCQVSDTDWSISRVRGIYGNRKNKPDSTTPLRLQDQLSVIRDLIAVRPGDLIFFHVIGKEFGISGLHGPYTPSSDPYFDNSPIWKNQKEVFPFRFLFKPYPGYEAICDADMSVRVSDIYQAIEALQIWSLATLENERNIERRAVRKISFTDAQTILNIFLREFRVSSQIASVSVPSPVPANIIPMRTQVSNVGRYENAVKALLMDKLADSHPSLTALFPNYVDFMNETFVAPTTRKLMDILVISTINEGNYHYYIVEAKNSNFKLGELRQLMLYIDLFRQRAVFHPGKDKISACALAAKFAPDTENFRNMHNTLSPYDPVILIEYKTTNQAKDAVFAELPVATSPPQNPSISPIPWGTLSPIKDIIANVTSGLPCCPNNGYFSRNISKQPTNNSFIIEEKNKLTSQTISLCYAFIWDKVFSISTFHSFLKILYEEVAPLTSYNFRAINPVIISSGYEPLTLNYIATYNDLSVRRPILVYDW